MEGGATSLTLKILNHGNGFHGSISMTLRKPATMIYLHYICAVQVAAALLKPACTCGLGFAMVNDLCSIKTCMWLIGLEFAMVNDLCSPGGISCSVKACGLRDLLWCMICAIQLGGASCNVTCVETWHLVRCMICAVQVVFHAH